MKPLGGGKLHNDFLTSINYAKDFQYKHPFAVVIKNRNELIVYAAIFNKEYNENFNEKKLFFRKDLCSFCRKCIDNCSFSALSINNDDSIVINKTKCTLCGYCISKCENFALMI